MTSGSDTGDWVLKRRWKSRELAQGKTKSENRIKRASPWLRIVPLHSFLVFRFTFHRSVKHDLDPAIQRAPFVGGVIGDRLLWPPAFGRDTRPVGAVFLRQDALDGSRAPVAESLIRFRVPRRVGVTRDLDLHP